MKIRLGVIGPSHSIKIIQNAVKEFDEIMLLPFPYIEMEETQEIISANKKYVDQWFFSGQAPYDYAVTNQLILEEEGLYAPLNSNSLNKTLLEAQLQEQKIFRSISLDTIQIKDVQAQTPLNLLTVRAFPYKGYHPVNEIIDFHLQAFEEGQIDAAITCVNAVHKKLQQLGIPCYKVAPDVIAVRLIIQYLKQRGVSQWYRKAQVAIIAIEIFQIGWEGNFSYKMKYHELELKKLLLNYAERINGSFVEIGDGRYFLYTTRGEMELQLSEDSLFDLITEAEVQSKLEIRIGLGYGITSLEAEQNARLAIQYVRGKEKKSIVFVDENKKITESEGHEHSISYDNRKVSSEWNELLEAAEIGPVTVDRIYSMALHYRKSQLTSKELASWMNSTERNARRILTELENVGLAKITGEEQSGQRGRPRKVYELQFM
ncbi:hypothetical protein [Sporosarcina sp. P33]|uniref:hypothetical protein n=1 Tax=Sporosarcina sp. P33 TaxID=1930764 RepID=UPI0009BDFF8E|nr:hypothetical protein [Sporosarcina sp. P33]ARD48276.1 hypothetical protein SporoP33_08565 [Sporosarcina sp. P33]